MNVHLSTHLADNNRWKGFNPAEITPRFRAQGVGSIGLQQFFAAEMARLSDGQGMTGNGFHPAWQRDASVHVQTRANRLHIFNDMVFCFTLQFNFMTNIFLSACRAKHLIEPLAWELFRSTFTASGQRMRPFHQTFLCISVHLSTTTQLPMMPSPACRSFLLTKLLSYLQTTG